MPQLSSVALAGTLTQSTFTLEQPQGQFSHLNISDFDPIWLVVAQSNGGYHWAGLGFPSVKWAWAARSSRGGRSRGGAARDVAGRELLSGLVGCAGALPMWPPCHMGPDEQVTH